MSTEALILELGRVLKIDLALSPQGTARVVLDEDIVDFEQVNDKLYVMAEIGPSTGREDAYLPMMEANNFGVKTGGAFIGIDGARAVFTMTLVEGDVPFATFEADLARFLKTLRWWKAWLALPPVEEGAPMPDASEANFDMIRI